MITKDPKQRYVEGVGRRKTSVARVRVTPAARAALVVNKLDFETYFSTPALRVVASEPMKLVAPEGKWHIEAVIRGGGMHSQAEAFRHGLSRALVVLAGETKAPLKKAGMLTRDPRAKERRKFGLKKARKSPQWSKR